MSTEPLRLDQSEEAVPARRREDRTPSRSPVSGSGRAGVTLLAVVALANIVLWLLARPDGQPTGRFIGELCGAEAVLLFSCSLVLATLLAPIERAFGGLDRVALWHRRAAIGGVSAPDPACGLGQLCARPLRDLVRSRPRRCRARWSPDPRPVGSRAQPPGGPLAGSDPADGPRFVPALADRAPTDRPVRHGGGRPWSDRRPGAPPLDAPARGLPRRRR